MAFRMASELPRRVAYPIITKASQCGSLQSSTIRGAAINCVPCQPCSLAIRCMATGARGARGHGWYVKYRSGRGGPSLQGQYYKDRQPEAVAELERWNDAIFALNGKLLQNTKAGPSMFSEQEVLALSCSDDPSSIPRTVYFDFIMEGWDTPKRVTIELATAALPRTCLNFVKLCLGKAAALGDDLQDTKKTKSSTQSLAAKTGSTFNLGYGSTIVHKIEKNVCLCLGDVHLQQGNSGHCHPSVAELPHGWHFIDEGFLLAHGIPKGGVVSMLNSGVHRNDSRFLITTAAANHLDGRFVSFGRVKTGMDVIMDISKVFTKRGRPANEVCIVACGIVHSKKEEISMDEQ